MYEFLGDIVLTWLIAKGIWGNFLYYFIWISDLKGYNYFIESNTRSEFDFTYDDLKEEERIILDWRGE